jgi:hypothetical protein
MIQARSTTLRAALPASATLDARSIGSDAIRQDTDSTNGSKSIPARTIRSANAKG